MDVVTLPVPDAGPPIAPAAASTAASASRPPRRMPPGAYLQMRRMTAGLTVDEVAIMLGHVAGDAAASRFGRDRAETLLRRLEYAPAPDLATQVVLARLQGAFPFDPLVYSQLVDLAADPDGELPVPDICTRCGCTWFDPCEHEQLGPCAWADVPDGADPVCTHCQIRMAVNDA